MTTPEPTTPPGSSSRVTASAGGSDAADQPVTTLRAGSVDVDARKVGRVLVALGLAALTAVIVVLVVAGVHRNAQINRLHQHGVTVVVTVSKCIGLLGGSGSNAAGYDCRGTLTLRGNHYNEAIPGSTFRARGSTFRAVTVPGDPALLSPVHAVATEHASGKVFILPAILLAVLLLGVGILVLRRRHHAGTSPRTSADELT